MLLKAHAKYHGLSPKDVGLQAIMPLQITRTTAETGEQFTFEVPIYPEDTREQMNDRINFALSIMQDRLEDVNAAITEQRLTAQKVHHAKAIANKVRALEKRLSRGKITKEEYDKEIAAMDEKFSDTMDALEIEGKSDEEVLKEEG